MKKASRKQVSFQHLGDDKPQVPPKAAVPLVAWLPALVPWHHLLVVYGLFAQGITSDVAGTLMRAIPTVAALQLAYGYLIARNTKGLRGVLLFVGSLVVSVVLSFPTFGVVVLFGAPLSSHLVETFLLSVHLLLVMWFPLLILFRMNTTKLGAVLQLDRAYRAIFTNVVLSLTFFSAVGTWLGVIPIPLDWDRPWQQWPVTLLVGAYLGGFVGGVVSIASRAYQAS